MKMATPTEISIKQSRKAKGIIVPLLEDLFRHPIGIEDDEDREFLRQLIERQSTPRKVRRYSPSALGSCVRKVYFIRNGQTQKVAVNKRLYGIFFDGTFRHFKWQFALWKLHRKGVIELIGCEIYVKSKRDDYGGTLDALLRYKGELYIVDFKGMNAYSFMNFLSNGAPPGYGLQITGYGILVSAGREYTGAVENCLLIGENKNGPLNDSPLALHEHVVKVSKYKKLVQRRLEILRQYEETNKVPPAECTKTTSMDFQGCNYSWFCRGEVEIV